jgi:ribonuclease Z
MEVHGTSVSGLGTRLYVPELKLTLDIGQCSAMEAGECSTVAITHGHMDHVHGAAFLASIRSLIGIGEPHFILHAEMVESFNAMFKAYEGLDHTDLPRRVTVVKHGDRLTIGRGLTLEVFQATHRIPSVGYGVWKDIKKLRPEFVGLPGAKLGELRKGGTVLEDVVPTLVFAYTGDTTIEMLDRTPLLYQAKTLAMEVTFFGDYTIEQAHQWGHTHAKEVYERADKFQNDEIVFVHHSARHSPEEKASVLANLPEALKGKCRWL